ncbi:helix-turn-helix transcriptional regulator [Proteiniclasticum sp. C24MP]|uniref:helix-turn-helix transcriptional regulator n=1 Tax=Proteiniclasticum sp. C24MP TaxID=3374101 RepID=UPI0037546A73
MNLKLKFRRIEKGLTQFQLAELIGATNQTISEYERGRVKPSYDNMKKISEILDTPVGELFFDEK